MDTKFLETFLLVIDNGSIAAAARHMNLTPAVVAQRIRALEDEFGFALIARNGRTLAATEAGLVMVGRARDFLGHLRDLRALLDHIMSGELKIGAISTAITGYLPDLLSQMSQQYPAVDVHVRPGSSAILYEQVQAGQIDAAVIIDPPFELPKSLDRKILYREPLVLLKPKSTEGTDVIALLEQHSFIRYDARVWGGLLVDEYLRKIGVRPRERYELDALDAIAVLVDRGLGVALVPDWPPPWPAGLTLTKVPIGDRSLDRRICLVWSRSAPRLGLLRALVTQISDGARIPGRKEHHREAAADALTSPGTAQASQPTTPIAIPHDA
jgi:DNA-binding transcriptional LysR family regulator